MDFNFDVDPIRYNDEQRYVGFMSTPLYDMWFSPPTLAQCRIGIETYLHKIELGYVHVTDRSIWSAMDTVYKGYTPIKGDIFTQFNRVGQVDEYDLLLKRVIELVTSSVKDEAFLQIEQNKLNIWDTLLGDFNRHGLRQTPVIKLNNKRIPFAFVQRY
jgi:hypothetical protein